MQGLQSRGVETLFATSPGVHTYINSYGIATIAAGLDERDGWNAYERARPRGVGETFREYQLTHRLNVFYSVFIPKMLHDLEAVADVFEPDFVLHEECEYAAPILASSRDMPSFNLGWGGTLRHRDELAQLARGTKSLWRDRGLAPRACGGFFDGTYIDPCPPSLQQPEVQLVSKRLALSLPLLNSQEDDVLPSWVDQLPEPRAYLSMGTVPMYSRNLRLAHDALVALQNAGYSVIVTSPLVTELEKTSGSNTRVVAFLPRQQDVFERCSLVATSGGVGASRGAFLAGVPLVLLPQAPRHQQHYAQAIHNFGAGVAVFPDNQSAAAIATAIRTIDHARNSYQRAALQLGEEIRALPELNMVLNSMLDVVAGV